MTNQEILDKCKTVMANDLYKHLESKAKDYVQDQVRRWSNETTLVLCQLANGNVEISFNTKKEDK